jgi:segregation and condensation protein B
VPTPLRRLIDLVNATPKEVKDALRELGEDYQREGRGIRLVSVAGGFQLRTAAENSEWVRAALRTRPPRLPRASLETLAIIAYKQPATRAEIEAIRGVDCDSAISSLLSKRLVKIAGRKEAVGRPLMYATTPEFLEVFSLKDLRDLPVLKEIGPVPETDDEEPTEDSEDRGAIAEDLEPLGRDFAPSGGGDDSSGAGAGERTHGDEPGSESGSETRPDHG